MKVNLSQQIKNLDGETIKTDDKDLTLGRVCVQALTTPLEADSKLAGEKVAARWKLIQRLHGGNGDTELTPEEVAEIRNRLPQTFTVIVAGQAYEMLNG